MPECGGMVEPGISTVEDLVDLLGILSRREVALKRTRTLAAMQYAAGEPDRFMGGRPAWRDEGIFKQLNTDLTALARQHAGHRAKPTAAIIDTQSVKTSTDVPTASQGIDANKKIVGRKRAIVTDTLGLLLAVVVLAASVTDNNAGIRVINQAKPTTPR
jgi:hypothetical protein